MQQSALYNSDGVHWHLKVHLPLLKCEHNFGCVRLCSDKCAETNGHTDMPHKGRVPNYIQLTNTQTDDSCLAHGKYKSPPWLLKSWYWDKGGGCRARTSTSFQLFTLTQPFFSGTAHCHLSALESPGGLRQVFPNLHTWLPFSDGDSAMHKLSSVTRHWARGRSQPSQNLIDTHEKSLLVVLLTQDIISWWAEHWPEEDRVK